MTNKLISLNVWGGKIHQPLLDFVAKHALDTDVFCFQEVYGNSLGVGFSGQAKMDLLQDLQQQLPQHGVFFAPKSNGYNFEGYKQKGLLFGNAIFLRKQFSVIAHEEIFDFIEHPNYDWKISNVGKAQIIQFSNLNKTYTICNFHGLWVAGTGKKDLPERLKQSEMVKLLLEKYKGPKILCGDFNLLPETQSIKILEQGMENLISKFGINSTRSSFYEKPVKFADYVLVNSEVEVKNFAALPDEVSDHLALSLYFN